MFVIKLALRGQGTCQVADVAQQPAPVLARRAQQQGGGHVGLQVRAVHRGPADNHHLDSQTLLDPDNLLTQQTT